MDVREATIRLVQTLNPIVPGIQFRIGDWTDKQTWVMIYPEGTLQTAIAAVVAAVAAFDANIVLIVPITPLQARRALRQLGLYASAKAWVDAHVDPDVQDTFYFATLWERDAPWVERLRVGRGWTNAQVDNFFRLAVTL